MNRGKVGGLLVLSILATTVVADTIQLTEIPKLESRVDELTSKLKAEDQAIEVAKMKLRGRQTELEAKDERVKALTEQVDILMQTMKAKNMEIKRLKSQGYREVGTVGTSFEVTWYNDYNYTKSGRFVKKGVTVAVDPRVIPLNSWLELEFPDGRKLIRRADDTGGAVKGHVIDVYDNAPDHVLLQRGRTHNVKVKILQKL